MKKVQLLLVLLFTSSLSFSATVKAYFNHNQDKSYVDPYRKIEKPGDNLEAILIKAIDNAKKTIDFAVQEINLSNLAKALVKAKKRGVLVRVVLEDQYNTNFVRYTKDELARVNEHLRSKIVEHQKFLDKDRNGYITKKEIASRDALTIIKNAKIEVRDDRSSKFRGLMHHKFVVIDKKYTLVSSANFTRSGVHGDFNKAESIGNANAMIAFSSKDLSRYFSNEFGYMWEGKFKIAKPFREATDFIVKSAEGDTYVRTHFSPTNIKRYGMKSSGNGLIARVLARAKKSIFADLFVYSSQHIADTLLTLRKKKPKLNIEFLVDFHFANRYFSEMLDMWGLKMRNPSTCFYEFDNNPWRVPEKKLGIPWMNKGDKLHHKFAVVDGKYIIFGSHNWSKSANSSNDETLLVIENKKLAKQFSKEHERLFSQANFGPSDFLLDKIDRIDQDCGE